MTEEENVDDVLHSEGKLRAQEAVAAICCHHSWGEQTHMALITVQALYMLGAVCLALPEADREAQLTVFLSRVPDVTADLQESERTFNEQQEQSADGRGTSSEQAG
jgi:hypothetical protein